MTKRSTAKKTLKGRRNRDHSGFADGALDTDSRKIVGWWLAAEPSMDIAAKLIEPPARLTKR